MNNNQNPNRRNASPPRTPAQRGEERRPEGVRPARPVTPEQRSRMQTGSFRAQNTGDLKRQNPAERTGDFRAQSTGSFKAQNTGNFRAQPPQGARRMPERPSENDRPEARPFRPERRAPAKKSSLDDYLIWFLIIAVVLLVAVVVTFCIIKFGGDKPQTPPTGDDGSIQAGVTDPDNETTVLDWAVVPSNQKAFIPKSDSSTQRFSSSKLYSSAAIMVDLKTGKTVGELNPDQRIYPASLTKVMTVIVACENIRDMNAATFSLTTEKEYPLYKAGASQAYFAFNKKIPMIDLVYGAILPSGADACLGLCESIAGSEEKFVEMMNQKAAAMGLTGTHFTNASGLHDENHYSTARDMATIMSYAMNNKFLRKVLSAATYESITPIGRNKKENHTLSARWAADNRLSANKPTKATFLAGKTGYTPEAGQCLSSVYTAANGTEYVIVSAGATDETLGASKELPFKDAKYLVDTYLE